MADTPLHSMTENTTPATTDEMYLLDNPGGSPADNRITIASLFKIINSFTADSTPDNGADYVATWDNSTGVVKKVLLSLLGGYYVPFGSAQLNPADSTTYYLSNRFSVAPGTSIEGFKLFLPRAGTIKQCYIQFSSAIGSAETSTVSLRLNGTSDTTIVSTVNLSASPAQYSNTALSITVAAADYITIKWASPAWATNPTAVDISGFFWVE